MDAIVLAGGYATRLWPITRHRPKMFLPVGETTVIDRIFDALEVDDRIDRVFVSTNERFADDFREHLAASDHEKPRLTIEETTEEDEKFGVVGALAQLVDREGLSDDTLVIAGDNVVGFDVADFLDHFAAHDSPTLAAYDVGSRERATSYGLVELEDGRVVDFQEKPENPNSTLVSIACYAFRGDDLPLLDEYLAGDNNPDEPGWFVQWLQAREDVNAFTFDEPWFDIGEAGAYLDAVEWALDDGPLVADDATVERSDLGPAVHVMPGAEVVDSDLDRALVFPDATVRDATLADSIVDECAHVVDLHRRNALVGAYTRLPDEC
jgi:glucose-1-phosphate thymidylyltransferase